MIAPTPEHKVLSLNAGELPCEMAAQHICRTSEPKLNEWVEFLVRPEMPFDDMNPLEFVEFGYERRGLLFDQDIVRRSVATAALLPDHTWFSINIHPSSLHRERFASFVRRILDDNEIHPSRLVIELVEFGGPVNLMASRSVIEILRGEGVRFALDDFGPGFSNLDLLGAELIDFVKLDRSLIRFIDTHTGYKRLIHGLDAMAKQVGVALVAEGVESRSQEESLRDIGVEWVQGFFYSEPSV